MQPPHLYQDPPRSTSWFQPPLWQDKQFLLFKAQNQQSPIRQNYRLVYFPLNTHITKGCLIYIERVYKNAST